MLSLRPIVSYIHGLIDCTLGTFSGSCYICYSYGVYIVYVGIGSALHTTLINVVWSAVCACVDNPHYVFVYIRASLL